ncbi:MAG: hypothetical protein IPI46_05820 [Bacteroidetes bacterium]|nr:hypothetical protein [Bacteroidota bacterium]
METVKKLGIWMCHNSIHLIESVSPAACELKPIDGIEKHNIALHDAALQNEAFHQQTESFKKMATTIQGYHEVVLFGPVDSKIEFLKFLKADQRFEHIKIDIKQTQIMSEDQQEAFIENHFSTH